MREYRDQGLGIREEGADRGGDPPLTAARRWRSPYCSRSAVAVAQACASLLWARS